MKLSVAAFAGVFLAVACGGGGGGGGTTPPPPTQPLPGIAFSIAGAAGANSMAMTRSAESTATVLRLDLGGVELGDLYGVAFDLFYPSNLFELTRVAEGTLLAGELTVLQFDEISPGHLIVGLTRLGATSGVSGSGTLLSFDLTSTGVAGTGTISFDKSKAFSSNGLEIAGVTWLGGTATVTL